METTTQRTRVVKTYNNNNKSNNNSSSSKSSKRGEEVVSPERAKVVWREKSPKYKSYYNYYSHNQNQNQNQNQNRIYSDPRKVAVVYYLCRNRQLEHPHFMEVPLSSPDHALYLRDVIKRLNVLRGRGMASLYSWSCKRSYKNGFVWHDLSEDDLILPAHGNEYVLKGSELFEESVSDRVSPVAAVRYQNLKQLPEPPSARSQDDSSSSSSLNGKVTKHSQEEDISSPVQRPGSSGVSPESRVGSSSAWNGSLSLTEYKVYKGDGSSNASTQTEEVLSGPKSRETCTRGVSTDECSLGHECNDIPDRNPYMKENSEISENSVSPPLSCSSASSSGGKTETLESLIRADVHKINSFRILEEEEFRLPTNPRLKATNMLMQLISCGSISVKDHRFGFTPTYRPRFSHSKFASPLFSASMMIGELDCLSENPRLMSLRLEEKAYFSGSLIERKMLKEEVNAHPTLKRSSSYNADRSGKEHGSVEENDESTIGLSKCIPLSVMASLSKQPRSESMRSPVSDKPRNSSDGAGGQAVHGSLLVGAGRRITEPVSGKCQQKTLGSFREEEKVIKIEESWLQELGL